MCGIAGIIHYSDQPVDTCTLERMTDALTHRGPDDSGVLADGAVGLAHRRLSVIDVHGGHQPMSNRDKTTWVCYNGEIYNHLELRKELQSQGYDFRTQCDTEVLVHLYDSMGPSMLDCLRGMFAFAIYDKRKRKLLLARDRMGQKPLVYATTDGAFIFASELQALRTVPGFSPDIRLQSVHDYLTYQYVPAPHTIFSNALKLPPASYLTLDLDRPDQRPEPKRYWTMPQEECTKPVQFAECARELRMLLQTSVQERLMADVPLGGFLSGGVDSTIISGLMAQTAGRPVNTYTVGFENADYDERSYARKAAVHLGTIHHEQLVDPCHFELVPRLIRHCGEPFADASILPTFFLAQFARQHVTVALSGDGADELFGGYYRYQIVQWMNFLQALPLEFRRLLSSAVSKLLPRGPSERTLSGKLQRVCKAAVVSRDQRYLEIISRITENAKHALYGERFARASFEPSKRYLERQLPAGQTCTTGHTCSMLDLTTYLPNDILTKVDTASMATSLEVRNPFMDHRIVDFACRLPWSFKQQWQHRKRILLYACRDLVPPVIRKRRKMGFGVPLADWFRGKWHDTLKDVLLDPSVKKRGFFNQNLVEQMISDHCTHRTDHSYVLWSLLVFELWCQQFEIRG
ncbi:MAG: asparagine synthase (glutamine-hydrolyzing) [Candidatus Pacebacteria bacterium]|nr:asparagine synthase (glutamine-hydrolyzing) [Candidatus Paceibacterota bacterium]